MTKVFATLLVGVFVAPSVGQAAQMDTMPICKAFVEAWRTAYNRKDAAALAGMYDAETGTYSGAFWTASGRAALTHGFGLEVGRGGQMTAIACEESKQVEDIGFSKGTYSATAPGPNGKAMTLAGHWLATTIQRGKDYFILTHNANFQMPSPAK